MTFENIGTKGDSAHNERNLSLTCSKTSYEIHFSRQLYDLCEFIKEGMLVIKAVIKKLTQGYEITWVWLRNNQNIPVTKLLYSR